MLSDRELRELTEAIKIKDAEAEAFITEIEVNVLNVNDNFHFPLLWVFIIDSSSFNVFNLKVCDVDDWPGL